MSDALLLLGLLVVAIASAIGYIRRGRQIAELREQMKPFAEIVSAAIRLYEARKKKHDVMLELHEENNLLAKVKELLKLEG